MLFHGTPGSGKRTMVQATLLEIFGPSVERVKLMAKPVESDEKKQKNGDTIDVVDSQHHMEVAPCEAGVKDRLVVQNLIKEQAAARAMTGHNFRVVVLHQACKLSHDAQAGLRRTMERYMKTCRIILVCDNASKVIGPCAQDASASGWRRQRWRR